MAEEFARRGPHRRWQDLDLDWSVEHTVELTPEQGRVLMEAMGLDGPGLWDAQIIGGRWDGAEVKVEIVDDLPSD